VHFRTTQYSLLALFEAFISVIVLIAAISAEASVYIFILWSVIGVAFLDLALGLYILGKGGFGKPDFTILKPMLIYGLPLVPAGFSVWALNWIDRFVILQYLDMRSLGIYAFAYSIGYMVIPMLARPFWATYTPRVTASYNKADYVGCQSLFDNSAGAVVFLLVPAVVGMAVLSRFLVSALSPPDFSPASSLIVWVSSGYFFNIMSSYYSVQLGLIHKQYWPTIAITIAALCNYVLNTIMIPVYGLIGAAVATTLSFMIQFLIVFVRAKQNTKTTENWVYLIKVIICSLLMGYVVKYLVELMLFQTDNEWIILILGTAFGFISYALFTTIIGISPMRSSGVLCKSSRAISHNNDM